MGKTLVLRARGFCMQIKENRGFLPLLFGMVAVAAFLGFLIPYQLRTSPATLEEFAQTVMDKIGKDADFARVTAQIAVLGTALLCNYLSAIFLKRFLVCGAILLYGVSIALFYPYGPCAAAAILFCVIGFFRIPHKKRSGKGRKGKRVAETEMSEGIS